MISSDLPDLRVWFNNGFAQLSTGGRFRYFLSNSFFTSLIPLFTTSVRVISSLLEHSSSNSSSSPLIRSCKLLSRLLVPLIGRPVLGNIFSPHFCKHIHFNKKHKKKQINFIYLPILKIGDINAYN